MYVWFCLFHLILYISIFLLAPYIKTHFILSVLSLSISTSIHHILPITASLSVNPSSLSILSSSSPLVSSPSISDAIWWWRWIRFLFPAWWKPLIVTYCQSLRCMWYRYENWHNGTDLERPCVQPENVSAPPPGHVSRMWQNCIGSYHGKVN